MEVKRRFVVFKSQANAVFSEIVACGLVPSEFSWSERTSRIHNDLIVSRITHLVTDAYFDFEFTHGQHCAIYFPQDTKADEYWYPKTTWPRLMQEVSLWLKIVKREHEAPSLWDQLSGSHSLLPSNPETLSNVPFDENEQRRVSLALNEIKQFLHANGQYTSDQIAIIDSQLAHLDEASKRLGRKDWIVLALGGLTNIIVGIALAPDIVRELMRCANAALGWVFGATSLK